LFSNTCNNSGLTWQFPSCKRSLNSIPTTSMLAEILGSPTSSVANYKGAVSQLRHPVLEDAGIEGYVWHANRHTSCSWLAMAGASIKEIQELAGHKSNIMSARYSHLSPEHRLSVVERITGRATAETNSHSNATKQKIPPRLSGDKSLQTIESMVPGGGLEPPRPVRVCGF
jgi:integrase